MRPSLYSFHRAKEHAVLGGICAGFAYQLEMPAWIVRIIICLIIYMVPFILTVYILLCFFVPEYSKDPEDFEKVTHLET